VAVLEELKKQLNSELPMYISNKLIEAHFTLTLGEQRLLYMYISKLSEENLDFPELRISVQDFTEMMGLMDPNYHAVKERCKKLLERIVEIETEKEWIGFQWFSVCRYEKGEGRLRLRIHDELRPYLLRLKKEYTRLITKQVMQFGSVYSIRIYMLCKQYQSIGKRLMKIEELKKKLGIDQGKYKQYGHFKKRVLQHAQEEINQKSDIEIGFEEIKKGRKVIEIMFQVEKNIKSEVRNEGIQKWELKSTAELAGILQKEIKKRWKEDIKDIILKYPEKDVYIEIICEILRGAYDERNIKAPRAYFEATIQNIKEEIKNRRKENKQELTLQKR